MKSETKRRKEESEAQGEGRYVSPRYSSGGARITTENLPTLAPHISYPRVRIVPGFPEGEVRGLTTVLVISKVFIAPMFVSPRNFETERYANKALIKLFYLQ